MSSDDDFADRFYPIQEDMSQQQRQWRAERVGWFVFTVLIIAALFGVFGIGVFSSVQLASSDGELSAEYSRFERNGASSQFVIRAKGDSTGKLEIQIEGALFERFSIENIHPQPSTTLSYDGGQRMSFRTEPRQVAAIVFSIRPSQLGFSRSTIINASSRLDITQFTYP